MAYTTINKHTDYFRTKIYTGNGSDDRNITWDESSNMQPDMLWSKGRSVADHHSIYDAVRGAGKELRVAESGAEYDRTNNIQALQTNGFQVGTDAQVNGNNSLYVSWGLSANGAGSANTDGTISSTVSVNTTAGFSIVKYTGTGSNATVGHGLGAVPKMVIVKDRTTTRNWFVYHNSIGNANRLKLDDTSASGSSNVWNNTTPTSSVFSIDSQVYTNASGNNFIAYCFAEKTGYSKIGSFIGNGNADGTFIYTGFKPAFILVRASNLTTNWHLYDNKRDLINPADIILRANSTNTEATNSEFAYDFVSNGFKARSSGSEFNGSGNTFIYYAVGQSVVGSNNVPCNAR